MSRASAVAPNESAAFLGRVWIGDDGRIAAVTRGREAGPAAFAEARIVDVGDDLVLPGLIDLHNHLAYNTLPLWTEPSRTTPWAHQQHLAAGGQLPLVDDVARVRPDHRLPPGAPRLRRNHGNRGGYHLNPGVSAEEPST